MTARTLVVTLNVQIGDPLVLFKGTVIDSSSCGQQYHVLLHAPWNTQLGVEKVWVPKNGSYAINFEVNRQETF